MQHVHVHVLVGWLKLANFHLLHVHVHVLAPVGLKARTITVAD